MTACSILCKSGIECAMIELKLKRTALRWDFSFFAVLAVFFWLDKSGFGLTSLAVCAAHEMAHLAVMRRFGIVPESVTFYGAGIRISAPETEFASAAVQAAVLSAGCVMNFILAAALHCAGFEEAAAVSLFTGLFNLLPLGEFDGRRLLRLALISRMKPRNVDRTLRLCGIISGLVCAAAAVVFGLGGSFTLITTIIYIFIMSLCRV